MTTMRFNEIYDEMISRNTALVATEGYTYDAWLNRIKDNRRCLALYCDDLNIDAEYMSDIYRVLNYRVSNSIVYTPDNNQCYINYGKFHHTFSMIVTFKSFRRYETEILRNIDTYIDVVNTTASDMTNYKINYDRLCPLKTGIAMLGIPNIDVNAHRESFRYNILNEGLPYSVAYTPDIVHSTLVRFNDDPKCDIIDVIDEIGKIHVTGRVNYFKLGFSTWKLNDNECTTLHTVRLPRSLIID